MKIFDKIIDLFQQLADNEDKEETLRHGKKKYKERKNNMSLYSKFCAWLSGWPESSPAKSGRTDTAEDMMFAEEAKKERIREGKKPKGLKPKKKKNGPKTKR